MTSTHVHQTVRNRMVVAPVPAALTAAEVHRRLGRTRSATFKVHGAWVAEVPRKRVVLVDCEYTAVGADSKDLRQFVATAMGCHLHAVVAPRRGEVTPAPVTAPA